MKNGLYISIFDLLISPFVTKSDPKADVAKKATDKASATVKLKALGLTDDEIESLTGS